MKIAVTTENGQIFQHFGQCQEFSVFEVSDGKIVGKTLLDAAGSGHSALAGLLGTKGVDVLICGGIGAGARNMLAEAGIKTVSGISGSVDEAAGAYLSGKLTDAGTNCSHHSHEEGEGHSCSCSNHCH